MTLRNILFWYTRRIRIERQIFLYLLVCVCVFLCSLLLFYLFPLLPYFLPFFPIFFFSCQSERVRIGQAMAWRN